MTFAVGIQRNNRAFTLVELLVVMVIMSIMIGLIFPELKGFFRGRNLDNETRQFLSMTQYGRSQAIAQGIPVELWLEPGQSRYGLQTASGYGTKKDDPMTFKLHEQVEMSVSPAPSTLTRSNMWTPPQSQRNGTLKIRFQPDGFISDTSPENIVFKMPATKDEVWIAENSTHTRYEIKQGQPLDAR